jgi:hypothetical protein
MLKSGAAVTLIKIPNRDSLHFFSKNKDITVNLAQPFDEKRTGFLKTLSKNILSNKKAKNFPDLITFGYWCRPSNINRLKSYYDDIDIRLGLGLAFHVAPSNVPMNFAFSFIFSLLAGNSNIVRIPSRGFDQIRIFLEIFNDTAKDYPDIYLGTVFLNYDSADQYLTKFFSENSDARIIWGGDESVIAIKCMPSKERAVDVIFSDRYSGSIIDVVALSLLNEKEYKRFVHNIFNDIFLMDQNACSSPRVFFWLGGSTRSFTKIQKKLWADVSVYSQQHYSIQPSQVISKFNNACIHSIQSETSNKIKFNNGYLFTQDISNNLPKLDSFKINSGYVLEKRIKNLTELTPFIDKKFQTLSYFGVSKSELKQFIKTQKPAGIDRIIPIGSALDIGIIWDGYDLVRTLSRIIQIS